MEELLVLMKDLGNISGDIAEIVTNILSKQVIPLAGIALIVYTAVWGAKFFTKSEEQTWDVAFEHILGLLSRTFLLVWGVTLLGYADSFCFFLENAVNYTKDHANEVVADDFSKRANSLLKKNALYNWSNYSSGEMLFVEAKTVQNINNSHKLLTPENIKSIEDRRKQLQPGSINIDGGTMNVDEGLKYKKVAESLNKLDAAQHEFEENSFSFFSMDLDEMVATLVSYFALIIQIIIRAIRMVFLIIFKVAFPVVVLLSIFPTKKKILATYFEAYTGFLLWTVVIVLVEIANKVIYATLTVNGDGDANTALVIIFGIIIMITNTVVPNITVMLFGGNTVSATVFSAITNSVAQYTGCDRLIRNVGDMGRSLAKKGAQKTGGIALMGIKSGGGTVANKVKSMFSRNNQDPQGE